MSFFNMAEVMTLKFTGFKGTLLNENIRFYLIYLTYTP